MHYKQVNVKCRSCSPIFLSYDFLSGGDYKHAGFTSDAGDMEQCLICSKNIWPSANSLTLWGDIKLISEFMS